MSNTTTTVSLHKRPAVSMRKTQGHDDMHGDLTALWVQLVKFHA